MLALQGVSDLPLVGVTTNDMTADSAFGTNNLVLAKLTMPENGWISRIGVLAGGADANTPAELVAYWSNTGYTSGRQTWDNVIRERAIDLPTAPYSAPAISKNASVYVGFWSDPAYTRKWGQVRNDEKSHLRSSLPGPNPPTKLPSYSTNNHRLSAWFEYIPNLKPPPPAWRFGTGETPDDATAALAPSFYGILNHDPAEGGRDISQVAQVQITDTTTGVKVYDKAKTITRADVENGYFILESPYTHTRNHSYSARFRHYDRFGVWSEYTTPTLYNIIPGPRVPTDMLPAQGDNIKTLNPVYYGAYAHDDDVAGGDYRIILYNADGRIQLADTGWLAMGA